MVWIGLLVVTAKTRNELAGFFKIVHVKSLPAHAVRSLLTARKRLVGQRVTFASL
ncbi:hypothetical protein OIU34_14990 [Pararhizobium sp. BT-229]|uniref:hypothetical protein n=1 Tax=Pararhizobium sp. BT-229 TaxID=2986923 RepID=UPI0021F71EBC|nr:hypothetical protein [Pararhizobium sp. BT-229]MCV9963213.1 hypothetical protein [Pararhizobium sp. BT-229]